MNSLKTALAAALNYNTNPQASIANAGESEILANGASFALQRAATAFLKSRERVAKNAHATAFDDLKAASREAKNLCNCIMQAFNVDLDSIQTVEQFCGFGREWRPNDARIAEFAAEHNITHDQAREALEVTMLSAQLKSQTNKGNRSAIYMAWLSDLDAENATPNDATNAVIAAIVTEAYQRAGEWLRADEGVLIRGAAEDLGVVLPKWSDVLPKMNKAGESARARVQKNLDTHAQRMAAELEEATKEINPSDW